MGISINSVSSSRYDDFLFAVICEDSNGTQLSVISALTRVDVDPWEEAARLEKMAGTLAQKHLVSVRDKTSGQNWSISQTEVVASKLVALLPSSKGEANSTLASERIVRLLLLVVIWWSFLFTTVVSTHYSHTAADVPSSYLRTTVPQPNSHIGDGARIVTD
jgi:hypothetical protein